MPLQALGKVASGSCEDAPQQLLGVVAEREGDISLVALVVQRGLARAESVKLGVRVRDLHHEHGLAASLLDKGPVQLGRKLLLMERGDRIVRALRRDA